MNLLLDSVIFCEYVNAESVSFRQPVFPVEVDTYHKFYIHRKHTTYKKAYFQCYQQMS